MSESMYAENKELPAVIAVDGSSVLPPVPEDQVDAVPGLPLVQWAGQLTHTTYNNNTMYNIFCAYLNLDLRIFDKHMYHRFFNIYF